LPFRRETKTFQMNGRIEMPMMKPPIEASRF